MPHPAAAPRPDRDRILVVAAPDQALNLLRLAILRSDDVLFVADAIPPEARRFATRFALEVAERPLEDADLAGAAAMLLSLPDAEEENRVLRQARRQRVPVHVVDRPLVSDFSVLAMLEHPGMSLAA